MNDLKVLELFSGIGGMHYALNFSGSPGEVIAAVEINPLTNIVYKNNFPENKVLNNNIQKLTPAFINKLNVNTILISPPCQPFTRNGNFKDLEDHRSEPLQHICSLIKDLTSIRYILLENVKRFEESEARTLFISTLQNSGFHYQEFILSPPSLGVPNARSRYYCLARRDVPFNFCDLYATDTENKESNILENLPSALQKTVTNTIGDYVDSNNNSDDKLLLPDSILERRVNVLDVCHSDSLNSMCFTKGYARYAEGTGSVFTAVSREEASRIFKEAESCEPELRLGLLKSLRLRYFSPAEVAQLMCFPKSFNFPPSITTQQAYRMLGNSINVEVVGNLIKLLVS